VVSIDSWWDDLVRDRSKAVQELVIGVIADEYQSLESILKSVNEWGAGPGFEKSGDAEAVPVSRSEVIRALRELIREGYAMACVLNTQVPHVRTVEFRESEINDLWFYITPKGQIAVEHLCGLDSGKS
jgi:hypothetical protein